MISVLSLSMVDRGFKLWPDQTKEKEDRLVGSESGECVFSLDTQISSTNKYNWLPRYNWNIVESGIKNHNPNL
jgi:hypothetical protein